MEKEEYIKPQTVVVPIDHDELLDIPASNHTGNTGNNGSGIGAKTFIDDEEEVESNKWGTTLPTSVPDAWKQVGE